MRGESELICMQDNNFKLGPRTKGGDWSAEGKKNLDQYS